jgi:hypothetical protein
MRFKFLVSIFRSFLALHKRRIPNPNPQPSNLFHTEGGKNLAKRHLNMT